MLSLVLFPTQPEGRTVVQQEEEMQALVQRLREIRYSRKRELHRLRSVEADLCHRLDEPVFVFGNGGSVPSQQELHELQEHLHALEQKKALRTCEFGALQREIVAQLHLVGAVPDMQFEQEIVDNPETFILSLQNLENAGDYLQRVSYIYQLRCTETIGALSLRCLYFLTEMKLELPFHFQLFLCQTKSRQ
ncbi:uncharacterized protein LOC119442507 [Dermacentor silvarum]|uniref:uncharacterized protein LOC119442507 n=1 Tax=Dermacentor silvarum TaxID=543639 RepID=UPI002100ECA6|nr:uncharacterized protein LOC119442507 [Dermacentor silvarum]